MNTRYIQENLINLLGWKQDGTIAEKIGDSLTISESGVYFQDIHPLVTLQNLQALIPKNSMLSNVPFYNPFEDTVFSKNSLCKIEQAEDGKVTLKYFKALEDTSEDPLKSATWEPWSELSEWLFQKTKSSINKVAFNYVTNEVLNKSLKNIIASTTLVSNFRDITTTVEEPIKKSGFALNPLKALGLCTTIRKVGLFHFMPCLVEITLIKNDSEVIQRTVLTVNKPGPNWFKVDWHLPHTGETYRVEQTILTTDSKPMNTKMVTEQCNCGPASRELSNLLDYCYITCYKEEKHFETNDTFGLSLDVAVGCEMTDLIVTQKDLFTQVLGLEVASDMLRELVYNPNVRLNHQTLSVDQNKILYELDGDTSTENRGGLKADLARAYKALEVNTDNLSPICLKCDKKGLKVNTI